ncbi:hypothetical protein L228DRAFT_250235 [Xylona heveae TC161]|uniref:Uncharacterized protein n=1 Tax=Xylona heveae (strain CBS 132557 / TC161) TaxID=1328760 RepID=A0A165A162_XYLHT|nr:hypothetical protein L228DRAFT_250235 [Xylona heveae TC161]KZF19809.1 hypothetical protein L228DRAFT_250235 [Xylona heveae TC161]
MTGFVLEFKRNYSPAMTTEPYEMFPIGEVSADNVADSTSNEQSIDDRPQDNLEHQASQIPPPRISENFRAPVNNTTNRRCQEWTTDYVRRLVDRGIIGAEALEIVQSKRDPPSHGIF